MIVTRSTRRRLRQIEQIKVRSAEERIRSILDERTERLAARQNEAEQAVPLPRALVCGAGRERFGLPVEAVAEVLPAQKCVPVPDGPPALVGLFGRKGRLVSVIDLARALGLEAAAEDESQHFVLLRRDRAQVALRVERAHAVADILLLTSEETSGFRSDAVTGYARTRTGSPDGEQTLSLLDLERLLHPLLTSSSVPGV